MQARSRTRPGPGRNAQGRHDGADPLHDHQHGEHPVDAPVDLPLALAKDLVRASFERRVASRDDHAGSPPADRDSKCESLLVESSSGESRSLLQETGVGLAGSRRSRTISQPSGGIDDTLASWSTSKPVTACKPTLSPAWPRDIVTPPA